MSLQPRPNTQPTQGEETPPKPTRRSPRSPHPRVTETEQDTHIGYCPYFYRERSQGVVYCEGARLKFPDKDARREILYRYCAHPEGYKACMLKQALDHYYERKYENHE